ncbi:uncharacterized protein LOC125267076 isoform X4 [Megalobrama amblycephala]|uniref:uncharacterized protein LOC125267076 isoform X4 n=1 Tax=Megalobrama amblycephala TaxID=75352 RepID=UPI002014698E|nr:uncharacterized protein LOC125267076 isoform X4 [Megalobrama amblycephala]
MELGLFLLPFGLPLGLFGVGDPLGSCCKKIEMGMAWVRAVWQEKKRQEEGTVPDSWVDPKNMLLYWPNVANATRYLKERRPPSDSWRKFPLVKEKMRSDYFEECDNCELTSSTEAEEGSLEAKRRKISKKFEDCLTDHSCDTDPQFEEEDNLGNRQLPNSNEAELELPVAPRKVCKLSNASSTSSVSSSGSSSGSPLPLQKKQTSTAQAPVQTKEAISKNQTRQHSDGEPRQSGSPVDRQSSSSKQDEKRSPYPMQEAKFQRKVMEMLVEIREDIRTLKKSVGDAEMHTVSKIPAQSSTVEELNILDKSLNCLDEKLRLIDSLSNVGGMHLKDNVKRVMEKLMTNDGHGPFQYEGGEGEACFHQAQSVHCCHRECPENNKRDGGKYCSGHRLLFKICPRQGGWRWQKKKL